MNRKLYIKWQIWKWAPLALLTLIGIALPFILVSANTPIYPITNSYGYYYSNFPIFHEDIGEVDAGVTTFFAASIVFAVIIPLVVYSIYYDKNAADAYRQFPAKPREIRIIRVLIGLSILLLAVTIAYWSGVLIRFLRQTDFNRAIRSDDLKYYFDYGYYGIAFLYIVAVLIGFYFLNCTLCQLASKLRDAALLIIFTQGTLAMIFVTTYLYLVYFSSKTDWLLPPWINAELSGFSITFNATFIDRFFGYKIIKESPYRFYEGLNLVNEILQPILMLSTGVFVFLGKEPSGENFGRPDGIRLAGRIIVHVTAWVIGMFVTLAWLMLGEYGFSMTAFLMIFLSIAYIILYYLVLASINRRFAIKDLDLIIFANVLAFCVVIGFALGLIFNCVK